MAIVTFEQIVELRSSFADFKTIASGGKLLIKTWLKTSNWVGVLGLLASRGVS